MAHRGAHADHQVRRAGDREPPHSDPPSHRPVQRGEPRPLDCMRTQRLTLPSCMQAFLTEHYLGIVMEFVGGGDMFEYVVKKNGLREEEARWFFQQLIVGLDYCHRMVRWGMGNAVTRGNACMRGGSPCRLWHTSMYLVHEGVFIEGSAARPCNTSSCFPCAHSLRIHSKPPLLLAFIPLGHREPRHQAREHAAGQQPAAARQAVRLWVL